MTKRGLVLSLFWFIAVVRLNAEEGVKFFRDRIEPVLKKQCYACHSGQAKAVKGGLRLDSRGAMRQGGESGAAIVPGNVSKSLLISALRHEGLEMPPKGKLPKRILADFVKWVELGAPDPRVRVPSDVQRLSDARNHWSFQPIRNVQLPSSRDPWIRNGIDRFILRRLSKEGVQPSEEADRQTLLRRLYLDLIGLPPTPQQVEAFLADPSQDAYQKVVDELLGSPHYGERWGRYWLDMARYADSNGYESDRPRPNAWRWRDWVIQAFNQDMPFDQFTIEQLAGDLLPDASVEQRVATGFHRNTLVNTEGGVDREEDRVKRTVDRTNTLGKVWLGLTLGCCQCHSHKYDPISQHEYYSLYAFFNSLAEPDIPAPTRRQIDRYQLQLEQHNRERRAHLEAIRKYRSSKLLEWEASKLEEYSKKPKFGWRILNPRSMTSVTGAKLQLEKDLSVFVQGPNDRADTYTVVADTSLTGITAIRVEAMADARLPSKGPGLASNGNFVLSSVRVYAKPASDRNPQNKGRHVKLKSARADFSQGGRQVTAVLGDDPNDGWAVYPEVGKTHTAVFELEEDIQPLRDEREPMRLTIELDHQVHDDHNLGRFRLAITTKARPVPDGLIDSAMGDVLTTPREKRNARDVLRLYQFFAFREPELDKLIAAVEEHRKTEPKSPSLKIRAQVVSEQSKSRITQVHVRGSFLDKGDVVQRSTLAVLPQLKTKNELPSRIDLANWLVSRDNPLTARVIVNRIWQQHFGRGIVVTDDDFGTQGELPSHPELLDWLAFQFRENGWSIKQLHRLIVTSATWRQSSMARPELAERDPYNTWLARQNRIRVEAEIIRDLALSTGGLLRPRIGGPSVYPPQPKELVKLGFQTSLKWPESKGADRYRRGMYTFFQRTVPYPMLIEFDAADSNASCTRRERSNTPLQSLTLWNDPVFIECARALGERIVSKASAKGSVQNRIEYAFQIGLARTPTTSELAILTRLYDARLRSRGESSATFAVARAIMNLDEFITRE